MYLFVYLRLRIDLHRFSSDSSVNLCVLQMEEAEEEEDAADRFLELIQTLLQNPEEREEFFLVIRH